MPDQIKAPPRAWYGPVADMLRKGASKIRPYEPGALPLVSDTLDSLGRGVDAWSYGDRMFGPPANAPLVNERTQNMIGALPLGAGSKALGMGASLAQLVPARPLLNADATAAARLAKRIAGADDAVKQGGDVSEIWKQFGLTPAPGLAHPKQTGKVADKLYHTRWLEEIEPQNAMKPGAADIQTHKYLDQVMDSPDLLRQYPFLRDVEFHVSGVKNKDAAAWFKPQSGTQGQIEMFDGALKQPGSKPGEAFGDVASHEISHAVMAGFGQSNAYGHGVSDRLQPSAMSSLADMTGYMQADPFADEKYGWVPEQLMKMLTSPQGRSQAGNGWWDRSAGETIAELVSKRRQMTNAGERLPAPTDMYDPTQVINDNVMDKAASFGANAAGYPPEFVSKSYIEALRRSGTIPK